MSDGVVIETTYTPAYEETFAASRLSSKLSYNRRQKLIACAIPFFAMVIVGILVTALVIKVKVVYLFFQPLLGNLFAAIAVISIFIAILVFWLWSMNYYTTKIAPQMSARWIAERKALKPLAFLANDSELRWESEISGVWMRWTAVDGVKVTSDLICFLVGAQIYFLPRRAFKDQVALAKFMEFSLKQLPDPVAAKAREDKAVTALLSSQ